MQIEPTLEGPINADELVITQEQLLAAGFTQDLIERAARFVPEVRSMHVDPDTVVLHPNIREYNADHVIDIAVSMAIDGQIQECIADTVLQNGAPTIRIIAGLHRTVAMKLLNGELMRYGYEPRPLRVMVYGRELSPFEIFELQRAENKHAAMKPIETARALLLQWREYQSLMEKATVAGFSRTIGVGAGRIFDAIVFSTLEPHVIELVRRGSLFYSTGVDIARRIEHDKQWEIAEQIIRLKYTPTRARVFIDDILNPDPFHGYTKSLFGDDVLFDIEEADKRLSLRTTADGQAKQALGYFRRIRHLMELMPEGERLALTSDVRDILAGLIVAAHEFEEILNQEDPTLAKSVARRVAKLRQ